jgi:hypothetical protein
MLTITLNGRVEKLNIGCRTFVSLDILLKILEADDQEVTLNGETVRSHEFGKTTVTGGDTLGLAFLNSTN